jgi:hypothetical protein
MSKASWSLTISYRTPSSVPLNPIEMVVCLTGIPPLFPLLSVKLTLQYPLKLAPIQYYILGLTSEER